jgi:predicted transcriptional regulator of viral defense system
VSRLYGSRDVGLDADLSRAAAIPTVGARSYLRDTVPHMAPRRLFDMLVARAADQHGYVTTRDARELGIDPTQLRLMTARGRLERAGRGAYRVPALPRGAHDDLAAAVAWSLGRAVVSHESALVLHGLSDVNPSRIQLSVPRDNHPRARGGQMYRTHRRQLAAVDVVQVGGIPVTTVELTISDCLETGTDPYQLARAIDHAEVNGTLRPGTATALRQRGSTGTGRLELT